jgi:hypothetical protein
VLRAGRVRDSFTSESFDLRGHVRADRGQSDAQLVINLKTAKALGLVVPSNRRSMSIFDPKRTSAHFQFINFSRYDTVFLRSMKVV